MGLESVKVKKRIRPRAYVALGGMVAAGLVGLDTSFEHDYGADYMQQNLGVDLLPGQFDRLPVEHLPPKPLIYDFANWNFTVPDWVPLLSGEWDMPYLNSIGFRSEELEDFAKWTPERWLALTGLLTGQAAALAALAAYYKVPGAKNTVVGLSTIATALGLVYSVDHLYLALEYASAANMLQWGGVTTTAGVAAANRARAIWRASK
ncbi:MAG: hypothetical protein AAB955_03045 [Patescibacteria group bacterium]